RTRPSRARLETCAAVLAAGLTEPHGVAEKADRRRCLPNAEGDRVETPDGVDRVYRPAWPGDPARVRGRPHQLQLHAIRITESDGPDVRASGLGAFDAELAKAARPVGQRPAGNPKRDHRHPPAALRAAGQMGPGEERHRRPRRTQPVAVVKVICIGHVEVDGLLHEPEAEHTDVEIHVALRAAGDGGYVMYTRHGLWRSLLHSPTEAIC